MDKVKKKLSGTFKKKKNWSFFHPQYPLVLAIIILVEGQTVQKEQVNKLAIINRTVFGNAILIQRNTGIYYWIFRSITDWSIKYTVRYRYHSFVQDFPETWTSVCMFLQVKKIKRAWFTVMVKKYSMMAKLYNEN